MKKMHAICLSCGRPKPWFGGECENCHFVPASTTDKAKSLILSTDFEIQTSEYGNEDISMPWEELTKIGNLIAGGQQYVFQSAQLALAARQVEFLDTLTPRKVVRAALLWLLPVFIAMGLAVFLIFRS